LIFVVNGANAVCLFAMRSTISWNMVVPLDKRHGVQIFACVNAALHVALERSVVDSTGSFTNEIWLEQHFHVKETFIVDSDDVSVWENLIVDGASEVSLFVMRSTIENDRAT